MTGSFRTALVALVASLLLRASACAGTGDTSWMVKAKYGIFLHYQHRILLGYSHGTAAIGTKPKLPPPTEMTARGWNRFVDGFDVRGFADQMAEGQVGWVLFCVDDHYFGWPCAPNKAFDEYTGYTAGGEVLAQGPDRRVGRCAGCPGREADLLLCGFEWLHAGAQGVDGTLGRRQRKDPAFGR